MPISSGGVPITMYTVTFTVLSFLMLVASVLLSRGTSLFGPPHGRGINTVTLAMGTFVAAFLFLFGLNVDKPNLDFPYTVLHALLLAIKTTGGGSTPQSLSAIKLSVQLGSQYGHTSELSTWLCYAVYFYHCVLCIVAPVSFVSVLMARLMHFFSLPRACWRALTRDTYVFDELSEPNLTLAASIKEHAKDSKVNLVFSDAIGSANEDLRSRALSLDATCVQHPTGAVWRHLPLDRHIHIVLSSKDEERNITRASSIRKACATVSEGWLPVIPGQLPLVRHIPPLRKALEAWRGLTHMSITAVTTLRGAEALFEQEAHAAQPNNEQPYQHVSVRCIDWTRNISEKILREHPLFLLGRQPDVPTGEGAGEARESYIAWQQAMFENPLRHVVVVGAGHVGMEFLRLALSTSISCNPPDEEPLQYRFDVFDSKADAKHKDECQAKYRLISQTGNAQLLDELSCTFHLYDVLGQDFLQELAKVNAQHGGITYIVVALGDDFVTAQVSLRIRELFAGDELDRLYEKGQEASETTQTQEHGSQKAPKRHVGPDGKRVPPIIVAVLDQAELCDALGQAKRDSFDYAIDTMGAPKDMYTYDMVFGGPDRDEKASGSSERQRRATRAQKLFRKYKAFSYARSQSGSENGIPKLAIDWCALYNSSASQFSSADMSVAMEKFMELRRAAGSPDSNPDHWIHQMEDKRKHVYAWAEGDNLLPRGASLGLSHKPARDDASEVPCRQ